MNKLMLPVNVVDGNPTRMMNAKINYSTNNSPWMNFRPVLQFNPINQDTDAAKKF